MVDTNAIRASAVEAGVSANALRVLVIQLADEVDRLRSMGSDSHEYTHRCIRCDHRYNPAGDDEDCPRCGCDGTA